MPSTAVTATGALSTRATQYTTDSAAVNATSAWLRRIPQPFQIVDDDVPAVINAGHPGHVVELGEISQRKGTGVLASAGIDGEILSVLRQRSAQPTVDKDIPQLLSISQQGIRLGVLR